MKITKEEIANFWTHLPGIIMTLSVGPILIVRAAHVGWQMVWGMSMFVAGMLMMYTASSIYHLVPPGQHKKRLRVFDHSSIYAMIAGSYSPILIGVLGGVLGWVLFIVLWSIVLLGVIGKLVALGKYPKLSLAGYLIMGWIALFIIWPLWQTMTHLSFLFMLLEGVAYSMGAYFFAKDEQHAYFHAIWHVFILIGSIFHTLALFFL